MDLVVPDDWIATCAHLYASQSIPIDVVVLNQATPLTEYVYTTLMSVVDLVFPT